MRGRLLLEAAGSSSTARGEPDSPEEVLVISVGPQGMCLPRIMTKEFR